MININQNIRMIKNQNHLGGICMILSVLFFSLMDVLIKITNEYDVGQVMFSRAIFGLIPIFFLIPKNKLKNLTIETKQEDYIIYGRDKLKDKNLVHIENIKKKDISLFILFLPLTNLFQSPVCFLSRFLFRF